MVAVGVLLGPALLYAPIPGRRSAYLHSEFIGVYHYPSPTLISL